MRQYYTIVYPIEDSTELTKYLVYQEIKFRIGADLESQLQGFAPFDTIGADPLWMKYLILIDEYELSALKLVYDRIRIIRNRPGINFRNRMRRCFKWLLK